MRNVSSRLKRPASAFAVGAFALALAACSSGGASSSSTSGGSDTPEQITYLTHWGPDQVTQLEAAADAFHKTHPTITVKVQAVPFANLLSTLRTQGGSGSGPTMAGIYDLWLPELVRDGVAATAPSGVADDVTGGYSANVVQAASNGGKVYGIPNEVDLYALNYNKRLFKDAGISGPPTTFAELQADAKALTNKAAGQQGFGLITNWASGAVHPFLSLAASNGGHLLDGSGKAALTDPHVVAVADLYKSMLADGSIDPTMSAANADTTGPYLDNFANGKTGMIIMANWWQSALKSAMGDKYSDVATAPIPAGPDGSGSSSISYSWMTMVNANADPAKQDAAWKFLAYLNGPDSGKAGSSAMGDILVGMGILPSRTSDLKAHSAALADPFIATYVSELPHATPFPTVVGGAAASEALQKHVEALIFGQETPQAAMSSGASEVDAALSAGQ